MRISRRNLLKAAGPVLIGSGLALAGGYEYATRLEPDWLAVEKVSIPVKNLAPELEGFKVVQLSDLHLHPFTQIELIREVVPLVAQIEPDLIVLTGDYVLQGAESIFELAPVLAALNARHGIFAILGNHDLWTNAAVVQAGLEKGGIPVLVNRGVALGSGPGTIYLAGLDDGWSGTPDLKLALEKRPAGAPTILLVHEPDLADTICQDGRVLLQLSGHTHGGQVRLPGLGAPVLPPFGRKYDQGLYRVNEMWLYTNRGIGLIGPPVRFNCPPEITLLTLTRA